MRSPLLAPRWLGVHLLAVLVVCACTGLGYWQYLRAQEPAREVVTNPVEDLDRAGDIGALLEPGEYLRQDLANEAVTATGTFDPDAQLLAPALSPEGDEGYYVIAPLVTSDGAAVTVSRGWLPRSEAEAADTLPEPPKGEVTVAGWLAMPQKENSKGYSAVSMPSGQVERIASALLVNEWPYPLYEGYVVQGREPAGAAGDSPAAGGAPVLREIPPPDPPTGVTWDLKNLSYAAQWWVFGVAAGVFWISLVRREAAEQRDGGDAGSGTGNGGGTPGAGGGSGDGAPEGDDGAGSGDRADGAAPGVGDGGGAHGDGATPEDDGATPEDGAGALDSGGGQPAVRAGAD
ncbi:cytochrome oxidase assembly protein ShyY1 [Murinocardiopsis flavida]|uniref:SURF1-like protein n=1 Tax=Murinocardiopsis flavida TaxID=645275 RepID=A0A2P8DQI5_9ACTN|nr:SURF1 family protein [Murinocardiopsis flavida]PSK99476.1 cytochrome oxidase assembly protein ShyY1 [Murinocardiopsis flavida]